MSKPHFYCPSNLDLPALLKANNEQRWLGRNLWRLYYILTTIYKKRWQTDFDKQEYVPLNAQILQAVLHSKKARRAIDVLIRLKIIETNNRYRVGIQSRGYRFAKSYNNVKFREVNDYDSRTLPQKLLYGERLVRNEKCYSLEHEHLKSVLERVAISEKAWLALRHLQFDSVVQEDFYEKSIEFIQKQDWTFAVGKRSGRVFTNVTNLPRELRPYLRLDGRPLCEVDISACQPLLLVRLYRADEPERAQFLAVVLSGNFYEILDSCLERPYGPERRGELKKAVFTQIFFDRNRKNPPPLLRVFSVRFPVLAQRIKDFKRPDYRKLSHMLQRDESDVVIKGVIGEIACTTTIPVLTIHDSVLCFPEHANQVELLLKRHMERKTGTVPKTKVKCYGEPMNNSEAAPSASPLALAA